MKPYVSPGHVAWAYDKTIWALHDKGMSAAAIRDWMRAECSLHVSERTIRAVLAAGRPPDAFA